MMPDKERLDPSTYIEAVAFFLFLVAKQVSGSLEESRDLIGFVDDTRRFVLGLVCC